MNRKQIAIVLGIMCALLVMGIFIQINTVNSSYTGVAKTKTENELRDNVLRMKEKYDIATEDLKIVQQELEDLRNEAVRRNSSSEKNKETLSEYNKLLGNTDLKGPGLIITIDDADSMSILGDSYQSVVHDGDLLEVLNALRNCGAEAISINDHRIVSRTSITCIGNVIQINGEKVGAPFVFKAIGNTSQLYGSLTMPGSYITYLKRDGIKVKIDQVEKDTIIVPKYTGVYKSDYATVVE